MASGNVKFEMYEPRMASDFSVISTWWIGGRALAFMPKSDDAPAHRRGLDGAWPAGCPRRRRRCRRRAGSALASVAAQLVGRARPRRRPWRAPRRHAPATGSTTTMGLQPVARKTARKRQPMAPAPMMSTDSPGRAAARRVPFTTQASGSTRAATGAGHGVRDGVGGPGRGERRGWPARRRGRCPGPRRSGSWRAGRPGTGRRYRTWGRVDDDALADGDGARAGPGLHDAPDELVAQDRARRAPGGPADVAGSGGPCRRCRRPRPR